jgi:hypothetical protein
VKQLRRTFIIIFRDGPLLPNWDTPFRPHVHHQPFSRRSLQAMKSLADLIDTEGATRHFTTQATIAPERPLMFCTRSGDCARRILRTSFVSMGRAVQETGSRFMRLAATSFSSSLVCDSIRDGETEEMDHTGQPAAGQPTDTCCDTHRDCECTWWGANDRVLYFSMMARRNEFE